MSVSLRCIVTLNVTFRMLIRFTGSRGKVQDLPQEISQPDIGAGVAFVGLLDLVELKVEARVLRQVPGTRQLLDEREVLVVVPPVVVQLDLPDELDLDPLVLEAVRLAAQGDVDPAGDGLAVEEEVVPHLPPVLVLDLGHLPLVLAVEDDVDVGVLAKVEAEKTL